MSHLSIITVAGVSDLEEQAAAALSIRPDVHLFMRCVDRVEVLAAIRADQIGAIVCFGDPPWFDRQCVEEAKEHGISVVMVSDDPLVVLAGEQRDIPVLPSHVSTDHLLYCLSTPPEAPAAEPEDLRGHDGKLIAVWGSKGAPGRTTLAIELACELAALEPKTLLVDADPYGGDVLQLLGMTEELPTIVWASRLAHRDELSPSVLAAQLRRAGAAGPVVLPGLPRAEGWVEVSEFGWRSLLSSVREIFGFVVVDAGFSLESDQAVPESVGHGRNEIARVAVSEADDVVAVCGADPISLKHFIRSFDQLAELVDVDTVTVVVNRAPSGDERAIAGLIMEHIGKRVAHFLPDRPNDARRAVDAGAPIREVIRRSDISERVRGLAASFGGRVEERGFLTRLASRA